MNDLTSARLEELLKGAPLGHPFRYEEETGSTNTDALEWARQDAPHGALVTANAQGAGRGRHGRTWDGGQGRSILASFVLRGTFSAERLGLLGGAVAVAVARTLHKAAGVDARTKWPNDVGIGGKKIAGILLEALWDAHAPNCVVAGIGLNVNQESDDLPIDARTPPTSLRLETGREWDRGLLLRHLTDELARSCDLFHTAPEQLLGEWRGWEASLNREVEITGEGRRLRGRALDLLPDGSLLILSDDGVERRCRWGEVSLRAASESTSP